jgi:hypothetical protein
MSAAISFGILVGGEGEGGLLRLRRFRSFTPGKPLVQDDSLRRGEFCAAQLGIRDRKSKTLPLISHMALIRSGRKIREMVCFDYPFS